MNEAPKLRLWKVGDLEKENKGKDELFRFHKTAQFIPEHSWQFTDSLKHKTIFKKSMQFASSSLQFNLENTMVDGKRRVNSPQVVQPDTYTDIYL